MKLLLGTTVLCLAASVAAAQSVPTSPIARGSRLIGGTASVARSTSESGGSESSVTSISVSPRMLWFLRDRLAIGGELGLGHSSGEGFSSTSWRLGPAVQWYFGELDARTLPFVGAALHFGSSSSESGGAEFSTSTQGLELVAGMTRLLARNVGLTGELFFARTNSDSESGTSAFEATSTNFGVRVGLSVFLY
jgi:hypothetical protein